jgi:hypothetical protein
VDAPTRWPSFAVAREHGFPSWPALRAEAERRRRVLPAEFAAPASYWSLGGAAAIVAAAGELSPSVLLVGPYEAVMNGSLVPRSEGVLADPDVEPVFADLAITDDRGLCYVTAVEGAWVPPEVPGWLHGSKSLSLGLEPVPARGCCWLELRNQGGSAIRLTPSACPAVRVGELVPSPGSPAERELSQLALLVIELGLEGIGAAGRTPRCSAILARTAQIRQSGELEAASKLLEFIAGRCDPITGRHPAGGLPPGWSSMLDGAQQADGLRRHLDIPATLPSVNGTAVQLGTLVSEPGSWHIYLRARPGWWTFSQDHRRKWEAVSAHAEDDLGGMYLSSFDGSTGRAGYQELALRFRPRIDPRARARKLTFSGASEEVTVDFRL